MKRKIVLFFGLIIFIVIIALLFILSTNRSSAPRAGETPSKDILKTIEGYLQARENSVGADQSSPNEWLKIIRPIVTDSFFSTLQPSTNSLTSTETNEYIIAHNNNYLVKANISGCVWEGEILKLTAQSGAVTCNLTDSTIDQKTGTVVPNSSLEFGWSRNGSQQPLPTLGLIKQEGNWLINEDSTGVQQ